MHHRETVSVSARPRVLSPVEKLGLRAEERGGQGVCFLPVPSEGAVSILLQELGWEGRGWIRQRL